MNERIIKLLSQCASNQMVTTHEVDLEKFAELIIRECAELVDTRGLSYKIDTYGKMIKEHFGVE